MNVDRSVPVRSWEWVCLAGAAVLFAAIRIPLFSDPGLVLGWNSDAALFGLMARAMRSGADFPLFFWGQFYLGTLTSMLAALMAMVTQAEIGPLILRVAASLEVVVAIFLFWSGLRRVFGPAATRVAVFWLAAGPSFFFHFTIAPIGAEQLFLAAAVLFWYVMRTPLTSSAQWFTIGLIVGLSMYLHQGIIFLTGAIGATVLIERLLRLRWVAWSVLGLVIGYMPAIVGFLSDDPLLYKRQLLSWSITRVVRNTGETLRSDLWLLLADATWMGIAAGVCLVVLAIVGIGKLPWTRGKVVVLATIVFSAEFWLLSTYPYPGAVRYIVPVVPLIYVAAASGLVTAWRARGRWRVAATVSLIVVTAGLYLPRLRQVENVVEARSELYTNWPGHFDPRPTLAALRQGGYRVCYGEVWVAHKLEFLTSPTVRFVPVRSVHRTLKQSVQLIEQPGRKCFVDNFGRVTALSPAEEAQWRQTIIVRAQKASLIPGQ